MIDATPRDVRTFEAIADTFFPALPGGSRLWTRAASELGVGERLHGVFRMLPSDRARAKLRGLLRALGTRAGGLALYGRPIALPDLEPVEAQRALLTMSTGRFPAQRQAYRTLKTLVASLLASAAPTEERAPLWEPMGYPGPPDLPAATERDELVPTEISRPTTLTADVVVVGAGAGGSVAAQVLAQAGLDVVVLDKGPHVRPSDFDHRERVDEPDPLFEVRATRDRGVALYTGSCLGGGTVIGFGAAPSPPRSVLAQWDQLTGLGDALLSPELDASLEAVRASLGVNLLHSRPSRRDELLEAGLRAHGWHVETLPRNATRCPQDEACGFCWMGCSRGARRSSLRTTLNEAFKHGTRVVANARVTRVHVRAGRATGVDATVEGVPLTVSARAVVLAAGSLVTPTLLRRAGLGGRALGRHLHLHPSTLVWGRFDEPVNPWAGVQQARSSSQFADLDGQGYGVRLQTAPIHPVFFMNSMPWGQPRRYKEALEAYRFWAPVGVILRDQSQGTVAGPRRGLRWGSAGVTYHLGRRDQAHVREGVVRAAEVLAAAGAKEILAATHGYASWSPARTATPTDLQRQLDRMGYGTDRIQYWSIHQMGTTRMGVNPRSSVVDGDAKVHGVRGLYVMDASVFPSALGLQPTVTIAALAHRAATRLARHLGR